MVSPKTSPLPTKHEIENKPESTATLEETAPKALTGEVTRSMFTTEVVNKEPFDDVHEIANNVKRIYFFTEFNKMNGQVAKHLWYYQNRLVAEIPFDIKSDRWRAWSSKTLKPDQQGSWLVKVVSQDGKLITEKQFNYFDVSGLEISTD